MKRLLTSQNLAGGFVLALGAMVMAGWVMRVPAMVTIRPNFVGMVFSAGLCFALIGTGLLLGNAKAHWAVRLQRLAGWMLVILGVIGILENVLDRHIVDMTGLHSWLGDGKPRPGRQAPNTALGFLLSGVVLAWAGHVRSRAQGLAVQVTTFAVLALGLTGLVGYSLTLELLYPWFQQARMAAHTAVGMVIAGIGLWGSWHNEEWYQGNSHFKGDERVGFIGAAILVVIALTAGIEGFAAQLGVFESALGQRLTTVLNLQSALIEARLKQNVAHADREAARPDVVMLTRELGERPANRAAAERLRGIGEGMLLSGVSGLAVYDAQDREIARIGRLSSQAQLEAGLGLATPAWLLWDGGLYVKSRSNIVDRGRTIGALVIEQSLPHIAGSLLKAEGLGRTGEINICVNGANRLVCFPDRKVATVHEGLLLRTGNKPTAMTSATRGESGIFRGVEFRGQNILAAYAPFMAPGLGITVKQDTAELYSPVSESLPLNVLLLLALVVAGAILLRRQITPLVSRIVQSEERAFAEKERLRVTLGSIGDAVITTDTAGNIAYLNAVAQTMTGWSELEAIGRPLHEVFNVMHEGDGSSAADPVLSVLQGGQASPPADDRVLVQRDGASFAIHYTVAPIRDQRAEIIGAVLVFRDVTHARDMASRMTHQASHDALTGLINRREFERRLSSVLAEDTENRVQHALLYLDLDQFKIVNDTCGHLAGDELLRQLARLLQDKLRKNDTLARLGGDEFGVLLENIEAAPAARIAETLRQAAFDFRFFWLDRAFPVGVSIGMVVFSAKGDFADLLRMADVACYAAKDAGRNRTHVYTSDTGELERRQGEMGWVPRIRRALEDGHLLLSRQSIRPMVEGSQDPEHFEVLLRMLDGDGPLIPPMAFIPAAERYGLMQELDRWVVHEAFSHLAARKAARSSPGVCWINLSGSSICDPQFHAFVREEFQRFGIPPGGVCFEITETAVIANLGQAAAFMRELKAIGCRFALDDFGSGMSSFAYLKHLRVDYLKIDGGFVKDMASDPIDHAMVDAINRIGHVMGIRTVAEWVEDEPTLAALRHIGVDYAQGYVIEMPELLVTSPSRAKEKAVA